MKLYERIRNRRRDLGLSQEELAKKMNNTSRSALAKIETGACDISVSKAIEFAKALDVTVEWLMGLSNKEIAPKGKPDSVDRDYWESVIAAMEARFTEMKDEIRKSDVFLQILFHDRPDIIKAIKSMNVEGCMSFDDMICKLDAQKLDFIRNSVIMSFEQAKLSGNPVAKINVSKETVE